MVKKFVSQSDQALSLISKENGIAMATEKKTKAKQASSEKKGFSPEFVSFQKFYKETCRKGMKEKFGYKNEMEVPMVTKVTINTCLRDAISDFKVLEAAASELATITGQKPVFTQAKKSISNFKLREGMKIGSCVTLRGVRMYEFLNRLFNMALPRVRDFKGVSKKSFDGRGNYTLGITEQTIFPEINYDKVQKINGMNVTIVTSAKTDDEGRELLRLMGMPFRN